MTSYENPAPREGINTTEEHPLKEFAQLLLGLGFIFVLLIFLVHSFAGVIARQIPIEFEQRMVADLEFFESGDQDKQARLQALADELAPLMDLPEGMKVNVTYSEDEMVNAFATLGGNLVFFKGLVDRLESEEELAAVMGHEIAHLKYRHPITALGKGVMLGTLAAFAGGASGSAAGEWLIGSSTNLSMMKFSRDQERESDRAAAAVLQKRYGNIEGAQKLFERFSELEREFSVSEKKYKVVEMFRSHPYSDDRWAELAKEAIAEGWVTTGELTPLEW